MIRISLTIMTLVCAAAPTYAEFVAIESFDGGLYNDTDDRTVGYDFMVLNEITVTHLGYIDEGGDGLSFDHEVGLWSTGGSLLASVTVPAGIAATLITPGGSPGGGYRYQELVSPLSLSQGSYVIGGHYVTVPSLLDRYPHADVSNLVTDSNISLGGGRFSDPSTGFAFPIPSNKGFGKPVLSVNFIPEPSCIALALFGIPLLGLFRRMRLAA